MLTVRRNEANAASLMKEVSDKNTESEKGITRQFVPRGSIGDRLLEAKIIRIDSES